MTSRGPLGRAAVALALAAIVGVSLGFHLWGVRRNLPAIQEMDEAVLVLPAVNIASTGDLNPHRWDYPGSTVIYPLAGIVHGWQALARGGSLWHPNLKLILLLQADMTPFFLAGRFLSIAYGVLALVLLYLIGRTTFDWRAGLLGAALAALCPTSVEYAQVVRTDGPATFFGLLFLWLALRALDRPSVARHALAGAALGLAVSTRYFLAAEAVVLVAIDALLVVRRTPWRPWLAIALGLLAVPIAFLLSTPYVALDFAGFLEGFAIQAGKQFTTHLGADGLIPAGNFRWYLSSAIPAALGWPTALLAAVSLVGIAWRRDARQLLVALYGLTFLVAVSAPSLHWPRWLLPVLPVLALFAADALVRITDLATAPFPARVPLRATAIVAAAVLLSLAPVRQLVAMGIRHSGPGTMVVARDWVHENVPLGTAIAQEWYTAPIDAKRYPLAVKFSLADETLDSYLASGFHVFLVSDGIIGRYRAEPERYAKELEFYRELRARGKLLAQFHPSPTRSGNAVYVFRVD